MNNSNNQIKLKLVLLLPLLVSMGFVGFYSISNANQNNNLELNQVGVGNSLFPVMGYASIEIEGTQIDGFSSRDDYGGIDVADFIEFFTYRHEINSQDSESAHRSSGRVATGPVTITKIIDKATPLLAQGLIQNSVVAAFFYFFGIDPDTGVTQHAFTVTLELGRIISLRTFTVVGEAGSQIVEEVSFAYNTLIWRDELNGFEFEYSWSASA